MRKMSHDATSSTLGPVYQFYVAVQKCFEMTSGQKVYIERYGDVTVSAAEQVETKHYKDYLTDSHENFWKTLNNWMQDSFDETLYSSLILCTTQAFGPDATIGGWNEASVARRVELLQEIKKKAEQRYKERSKKSKSPDIPASLSFQRSVLDPAKMGKLKSVLAKFVIASRSPVLPKLYKYICERDCKPILIGKQKDFLNSLIGFVISPDSIRSDSWEVTYDDFTRKVRELTTMYHKETKLFPTKYLGTDATLDKAKVTAHVDRQFVRKIADIEYHEVIPKAIQDHFGAHMTILEEFRDYEVPAHRLKAYAAEVIERFQPLYRTAKRSVTNVVPDSQNFFDQVTAADPPSFPGFDNSPVAFRNGVLHLKMDEHDTDLKWRLD